MGCNCLAVKGFTKIIDYYFFWPMFFDDFRVNTFKGSHNIHRVVDMPVKIKIMHSDIKRHGNVLTGD